MAVAPTLARRLACVAYDALLLAAVLLIAAFPFVPMARILAPSIAREALQIYLLLIAGGYFTVFWRKGQTLAMKTWGIRIESTRSGPPDRKQAWLRYLLACLNLALLGFGWWSAWFLSDRQFLQDRLAGTRLIRA
ncbi:MAG: RDD family protein [Thiobacillaceae bacterium]|jgi:uncharacterized RDD family membrane protein YckC|nr:RDD family protein [Thiobacillaceae bacterium]